MSASEDALKSPEEEETEQEPDREESEELSEGEESVQTIVPVIQEEELGSEISKSITVVAKSVTHRGTQTVIHCKSDETKANFIDMIINTRV